LANENVTNVDSRLKGSQVLASSFSGVASQISAGADLKDMTAILKATKVANSNALAAAGVSAADWQQWDKLWSDAIYALYISKKANTLDQWAEVWRETASGLSQIK
jgi:hypothetical protein